MEAKNRDNFKSSPGFILACIGSAVGMGNIWAFPYRVGQLGGAAFLIPYLLFVTLIGYTGIVEEMTLGRYMKTGPLKGFENIGKKSGSAIKSKLGWIPVLGSLGIAIGYTVVIAWILKFTFGSITGELIKSDSVEYFTGIAGAYGSLKWHALAIVITVVIMSLGISEGIEKANKIMMPAFFLLFVILAIRVAFLPKAAEGYMYMMRPDFSKLFDIKTWVYALGQAFFSLSLAGSGTVVYGSYLKDDSNTLNDAKYIAIFDTIAAILAALVIIPAVFAYGHEPAAGPPLMFMVMPSVFKEMPAGSIFAAVFFIAVLFAGITSLINLYETPVEALQAKLNMSRKAAVALVCIAGFIVGIFVEDGSVLGKWMDYISIYIIPLGALIAAYMFFYAIDKKDAINELSKASGSVPSIYYSWGRYVFCGVTIIVYAFGLVFGAIG